MERALKKVLEAKHRAILAQERSWAVSVARTVIKPRPISVWEFLIPVLLIFSFAKTKSEKEVIIQNLLFTKELALKAALDMAKNGRNREEVLFPIEEKTSGLVNTVKDGIYSEEIRQKQLKEIHLLIDHYCRLLNAEGGSYASLVINAYQAPEPFTNFLTQLKASEKEVNLAAMQTLGRRADPELVKRMEETTDRVRMAAARKIFKTTT
ncbi:MAG: NF038143 family protein [Desulfobacteraceae bacterium]|jgi:hypothetical protein